MPAGAQDHLEIGAGERADTVLDDDRLASCGATSGAMSAPGVVTISPPDLRDHRERHVARADLGIPGAEPDDDVDHGPARRARARKRCRSALEDGRCAIAEAGQDLDLQIHEQQCLISMDMSMNIVDGSMKSHETRRRSSTRSAACAEAHHGARRERICRGRCRANAGQARPPHRQAQPDLAGRARARDRERPDADEPDAPGADRARPRAAGSAAGKIAASTCSS